MDIRPLEVPDEDPLEVRLVADAIAREEFKPSSNMFPYVDREVLNDEVVIIYPSARQASRKSSSHIPGFVSPVYLVMLVGGRKRYGNDALWMRQPKACGLGPFGLGLRSLGQ